VKEIAPFVSGIHKQVSNEVYNDLSLRFYCYTCLFKYYGLLREAFNNGALNEWKKEILTKETKSKPNSPLDIEKKPSFKETNLANTTVNIVALEDTQSFKQIKLTNNMHYSNSIKN
jgi:hypothetical protein